MSMTLSPGIKHTKIPSKSKENQEHSLNDSNHYSTSPRNRREITIFTLITNVEKDIVELISQSQIRSHKTKLISISETMKILAKRLNNYPELLNAFEENNRLVDEIKYLKESSQKEFDRMKKENEQLKKYINSTTFANSGVFNNNNNHNVSTNSDIINMLNEKENKKDDLIQKLQNRKIQLTNQLNEEKKNTVKLSERVKHLEESHQTLFLDYNNLLSKREKKENLELNEKILNDLKKSNSELKSKLEESIKVNSELKQKYVESENNSKLNNEEFKSLIKRNQVLSKKIEESEKEKERILSEVILKEERLQAVRIMNSKLEMKSNQILRKWESFRQYEQKTLQVSNNCNKLLEIIDELNKKLVLALEDNEKLQDSNRQLLKENTDNSKKIEEFKEQVKSLDEEKEDLYQKNIEFEVQLKKYLDYQRNDNNSFKEKDLKERSVKNTKLSSKDVNKFNQ